MRVFFAIILPRPINKLLGLVSESLQGVMPKKPIRWVAGENYHITLQFLKSIQTEHLASLIEQVDIETKGLNAFYLEFSGLEWFPTPKRPTVLSMGVGSEEALKLLSTTIGQVMLRLDYPPESHPFQGHLTLGRLLSHHPQRTSLLSNIKLPALPLIPITEFYLMESRSEGRGVKYYPIAQFNLVNRLYN